MDYKNIILERRPDKNTAIMIINRPQQKNAINLDLILEMNDAMDSVNEEEYKILIIEGLDGIFCSGLDFFAAVEESNPHAGANLAQNFGNLLKRMTLAPQVIISKVNGEVTGGGVGLVAASDFVVATEGSQFCLTEALWGLLPAIITPYLIRKVGFHNAYKMAISALPYSASEALQMNLIDSLDEQADKVINSFCRRIRLMNPSTIKKLKGFYREMWLIKEETENQSISTIVELMQEEQTQKNIENFVKYKRFPWNA